MAPYPSNNFTPNRFSNGTHISAGQAADSTTRTLFCRSVSFSGCFIRIGITDPMVLNTVALYCRTSSQNRLAENFRDRAMVAFLAKESDVVMNRALPWHSGR